MKLPRDVDARQLIKALARLAIARHVKAAAIFG